MPTLVISIDGAVIKEVQLTKERTTLGRRPYNDIVIENLAVSGEHAVIILADGKVSIEDLRSTNGTFVTLNGKPELFLRGEECVLYGKGTICFAASASSKGADCAEFEQL